MICEKYFLVLIRAGHASLVEELKDELPQKPDLIITCVGGGGLLCGVVEGLNKVGWKDVPVLAMETIGADCLNKSVQADELVTLPGITRYSSNHQRLFVTLHRYLCVGVCLSGCIDEYMCLCKSYGKLDPICSIH